MFDKKLQEFIFEMKNFDSDLKEETIKPILLDLEKKHHKYSIEKWMTYLLKEFSKYESVIGEFNYLYNKYKSLEPIYREHRVNVSYKTLKAGKVSRENEVYMRQVMPYPPEGIDILWNISKAKQIVYNNKLKRANFPFNKMNIAFEELDFLYMEQAAKNQLPGFLINYEPLENSSYQYILIDGNHRFTGKFKKKYEKKNPGINIFNPSFIQKSNVEFPVFQFSSEDSLKSMEHPFFHYFYLIHVLYKQIEIYYKNGLEINDIIDDEKSRYNSLKKLVI